MSQMRQLTNRVQFGQEEDTTSDGLLGVGMLGKAQQTGKLRVTAKEQKVCATANTCPCNSLPPSHVSLVSLALFGSCSPRRTRRRAPPDRRARPTASPPPSPSRRSRASSSSTQASVTTKRRARRLTSASRRLSSDREHRVVARAHCPEPRSRKVWTYCSLYNAIGPAHGSPHHYARPGYTSCTVTAVW